MSTLKSTQVVEPPHPPGRTTAASKNVSYNAVNCSFSTIMANKYSSPLLTGGSNSNHSENVLSTSLSRDVNTTVNGGGLQDTMTMPSSSSSGIISIAGDTSIIIISNLSKNSPNTSHVDLLYKSLVFLQGLSPTTPIYIAIDGLVEPTDTYWAGKHHFPPNNIENLMKLDSYIRNLRLHFINETRVHILPFLHWQMHNNLINKALEFVQTRYVYVLQHDEVFIRAINHTAMVQALENHTFQIRKIEFGRLPNKSCWDHFWFRGPCSCNVTMVDSTAFTKTSGWSDQCHFTTKEYYLEVLKYIGTGEGKKMHPEAPMNRLAHRSCDIWGSHFYGDVNDTFSIIHSDERLQKHNKNSLNYTDIIEKAHREHISAQQYT